MSLKEIKIQGSYRTSNDDDALNNFYIPCLENCINYKRKSGYFSSSIFQIADQGFREFFKNNGRIKLLVSHLFVKDDTEILKNNPNLFFNEVGKEYKEKFQQYIKSEISPEKVELFATLLANKRLEIKIHYIPSNDTAAYHAKAGIFKDINGDSIVFRGGINESRNAWHNMSDEIWTERSWDSKQAEENIADENNDFDRIWDNNHRKQDWQTANLPKALQENIIQFNNTESNLEELFEKAKNSPQKKSTSKTEDITYQNRLKISHNNVTNNFEYELYSHQKAALKAWQENNNQAIFKHVTGSGKTVTACHAIEEMLNIGKKCLIIVPSTALLTQWEEEIRKILGGVKIFLSSNAKSWKISLENSKAEVTSNSIFLTTLQTARLPYFRENFCAGEHIFLVVDECHSLWSKESNKVLSDMHWGDCPRMALSATPDDSTFSDEMGNKDNNDELTQVISFDGDESILIDENTDKIFHIHDLKGEELGKVDVIDFFKGDSKKQGDDRFTHKLSIGDAINSYPPILSRYWYYFRTVYLTEEETKNFLKKSQLIASYMGDSYKKKDLQRELLLRQRIINIANNKRNVVEKLLDKNTNNDDSDHNLFQQKWVVYVGAGKTDKEGNMSKIDGQSEIDWVYKHIDKGLNYDKDFYCYKYDGSISKKKGRRKEILEEFDKTGGVIFACKMLDEGVDIPRLSRAIIMASSSNDREFIQRRGRVLRVNRGNTGDSVSKIWDLIVLPDPSVVESDKKVLNSIKNHVKKETRRLRIFANDAENKIGITDKIEELENEWGIND
tara:strand:+ start:713 stop:3073 length:2361 start_codon:yes stop_codon:yes gene_type:complete